jgi:hypothetical protein
MELAPTGCIIGLMVSTVVPASTVTSSTLARAYSVPYILGSFAESVKAQLAAGDEFHRLRRANSTARSSRKPQSGSVHDRWGAGAAISG